MKIKRTVENGYVRKAKEEIEWVSLLAAFMFGICFGYVIFNVLW